MCSCTTDIRSIKFSRDGNMIYSCEYPPMVKISGVNRKNTAFLLNNTFIRAFETFTDSKKRLWVGGNNGFIIY